MSDKVNLRVERFSTFIIITYSFFISMTMVISMLSYLNGNILIIKPLLAGVLLPLLFSGWNCAAVNYVGTKKPNIMFEFNLMRFLINAVFVIFLMHVGVNWLSMNSVSFGLILFFTWFTLHMIEAFYSASFLKKLSDDYPNFGSN
tara:strand:+ start:479 stop:913 length:435 start_codon:yes stop_codon:yes gene_type:complete